MVFLYIFLVLILLVLLLPMRVSVSAYCDLSRKTVLLNGYLFGIHLLKMRLYFNNGDFLYSFNGSRGKPVNTDKFKNNNFNMMAFINNLKINDVTINLRYGALDDPFKTAILLATVNEIVKVLHAKINSDKFEYKALPNFNSQSLTADIKIKVNMILLKSLIDFSKANKEKVYE